MMRHEILHIWGPISIHSYGLAMAIGVFLFTWLCLRHPWRASLVSKEKLIEIVCISLFSGIAGARLLFVINSWHRFDSFGELFHIWSGGLSLLGSIIAILFIIPPYLYFNKIPVLPLLDLAALYAPLLHAITRLGCFMAGCCHGKPTSLPWAITYTDLHSEAPLYIPLHPTQLYLSAALFITFLFFYFIVQKRIYHFGQLIMLYLMIESVLRFSIDYWRNDIEYFAWDTLHVLSAHQWIAACIFLISFIGYIITQRSKSTLMPQA
jgi:phosphatidylglycerol:prolipoprotein diacylglycerol transferase